eukprot:TRINITY_DN16620_c0_g1_i1.p1 TRINITY_DN16620_c0_g1~~TRINITY_DN16620_c0_g1_i1.p1  ORF type:complete len:136 (-),score=29.43 TRINITY_DN16620_c0_g1_i1:66-473(-)
MSNRTKSTQKAKGGRKGQKKDVRKEEVVTRDYTIHLHKQVHGTCFKRRSSQCIKVIKSFAQRAMKTKDVRLDTKLNKHIWAQGIKSYPTRVRVRLSRRRNDDEDAKEKLYTLISHVSEVTGNEFRGLGTTVVSSE